MHTVFIVFFVDLGLNDNKSVFPHTLEEFGYKFNEGL